MKLEVGKSYRTRAGEKVTIVSEETYWGVPYPFKGSNGVTYGKDGRMWAVDEDADDLIALWDDVPSAQKYKAGDIVEIKLTAKAAEALNLDLPCAIWPEAVLSATKDPEPEFDWSTVKPGMAFHYDNSVYDFEGPAIFLSKNPLCTDVGLFMDAKNESKVLAVHKDRFSRKNRAPEHDITIEETK